MSLKTSAIQINSDQDSAWNQSGLPKDGQTESEFVLLEETGYWSESDELINEQLEKTKSEIRWVDFFGTVSAMATVALAFGLIGAVLDHWIFRYGLTVSGRITLAISFLGLLGLVFLYRIIPLLRYKLNPLYAADILEKCQDNGKNPIINWLLLKKLRKTDSVLPRDVSVLNGITEEAIHHLEEMPQETVVDHSPIIRWGIRFIIVLLLFLGYLIVSPKSTMVSLERIVLPTASIAPPMAIQFIKIEPGNLKTVQGETIHFKAEIGGARNKNVWISWSTPDQRLVDQLVPMSRESGNFFAVDFPNSNKGITESLLYKVIVGDPKNSENVSATYSIEVQSALALSVEKIVLEYPEYTRLKPQTVEHSGEIRAVEGTKIHLIALGNTPMKSAQLVPGSNENELRNMTITPENPTAAQIAFELSASKNSGDFVFSTVKTYEIRGIDEYNHKNPIKCEYPLVVIADQAPTIVWDRVPEGRIELPINKKINFTVRAEDPDFGLSSVRLYLAKRDVQGNGGAAPEMASPLAPIDLLSPEKKNKAGVQIVQGTIEPKKSPEQWQPQLGEEYEFWLEASDNKPDDPNSGRTEKKLLVITAPSQFDMPDENSPEEKKPDDKENKKEKQEGDSGKSEGADGKESGSESGEGKSQAESGQKNSEGSPQNQEGGSEGQNGAGQESEQSGAGRQNSDQKQNSDGSNKSGAEGSDENGSQGQSESQNQSGESSGGNSGPQSGKDQQDSNNQQNDNNQNGSGNQEGSADQGKKTDGSNSSGKSEGADQNSTPGQNSSPDQKSSPNGQNQSGSEKNGDQKNSDGSQNPGDNGSEGKAEEGQASAGSPKPDDGKSSSSSGGRAASQTPIDPESNPGDAFEKILEHQRQNDAKNQNSKNSAPQDPAKGSAQGNSEGDSSSSAGAKSSSDQKNSEKNSPISEKHDINNENGDNDKQNRDDKNNSRQQKKDDSKENSKENESVKPEKSNEYQGQNSSGSTDSNAERKTAENVTEIPKGIEKERGKVDPDTKNFMINSDKKTDGSEKQVRSDANVTEDPDRPASGGTPYDPKTTDSKGREKEAKNSSELGEKFEMEASSSNKKKDPGAEAPEIDPTRIPSGLEGGGDSSNPTAQIPGSNSREKGNGEGASPGGNGPKDPANSEKKGVSGGSGYDQVQEGDDAAVADDPNLKYAIQSTELALSYIEDQLKDEPDKKLLESLGWTKEQLKDFLDHWKNMREKVKKSSKNSKEYVDYLETLRNTGLRAPSGRGILDTSHLSGKENEGPEAETLRFRPPQQFKDRYRAYNRGISIGKKVNEN